MGKIKKILLQLYKVYCLFYGRFYRPLYYYNLNNIVCNIPSWTVRKLFYKLHGLTIGKGSNINLRNHVLTLDNMSIGENTHINRGCLIDARGG